MPSVNISKTRSFPTAPFMSRGRGGMTIRSGMSPKTGVKPSSLWIICCFYGSSDPPHKKRNGMERRKQDTYVFLEIDRYTGAARGEAV